MTKMTSNSKNQKDSSIKNEGIKSINNKNKLLKTSNMSDIMKLVIISGLIGITLFAFYLFFASAPKTNAKECQNISLKYMISGVLPKWMGGRNDKFGTVRELWKCGEIYKEKYPIYALTTFCAVYIALQTFAIPGPIVLSLLSGAMYPFIYAQILVAFCATTGASLCFFLSYCLGRGLIHRLFPKMISNFEEKIQQNKENIFYYLLFLRITPMLPNWFVNIASPMVNVKFQSFFLATLIGLVPANFLHISTGATLTKAATDPSQTNNGIWNFFILFCLQFIALLPTLFKSKLQQIEAKSFENNKRKQN